jgi:hypothetical protein
MRIELEMSAFPASSFATLTFRPEALPRSRSEVERITRAVARGFPFRYLLVSERGELRGRFHFHLLAFGVDYLSLRSYLAKAWPHGFVDTKDAAGRAAYVSKYVVKSYHDRDVQTFYADGLGPNVFRQSRPSVGYPFVVSFVERIKRSAELRGHVVTFRDVPSTIRLNGLVRRLPRYVIIKARELLGLPSYDPDREFVQELRRSEAAADPKYSALSERRRIVRAGLDLLEAGRDRSRRAYLDRQRVPAEVALSEAVRSGRYETRAARRRRLKAARLRAEAASPSAEYAAKR